MNNALMVSLGYFGEQLKAAGWDVEGARYLPLPLVAGTSAMAAAAGFALWRQTRQAENSKAASGTSAETQRPADTPATTNL
jgi:hypothetical protein